MVQYLGDALLPMPAGTESATRIATVFPRTGTIITIPGIHATQRDAYLRQLDDRRREQGLPLMDDEEQIATLEESVDLIVRDGRIFIRPDPERMDRAFAADDLIQEIAPKSSIRFLFVSDARVRDAIRRRGEAWRIHPLPKSTGQIEETISKSLISVGGLPIYFYNAVLGSRILTCHQFAQLGELDDAQLLQHLREICELAGRNNAHGYPELELFMAKPLTPKDLCRENWGSLDSAEMRKRFAKVSQQFQDAVPVEYRIDSVTEEAWRNRMYAALIGRVDDELSESDLLGLSAEFFMQIQWLPGARVEAGELMFDVSEDEAGAKQNGAGNTLVRGLICNLMQEFSDIEYINVGQVITSLCRRKPTGGRREVYVVHFRQRGGPRESLRIVRMQKYGVREHLDEGQDLLRAMIEAEDYTDYIMDRRLGCRQLGMNLTKRTGVRKVAEYYHGKQQALDGVRIWSTYYERDYISGLASDRIPTAKLKNPEYASRLAILLGQAAAPNLIVGRRDLANRVIFDDGDEVVVEDLEGFPTAIVVTNHTGTFGSYRDELSTMAPIYAEPINRRIDLIANADLFAKLYIEAFLQRFQQIQEDYRVRRRAFDGLFKHRQVDPEGNLAFRWVMVLKRLDAAQSEDLVAQIRANIHLPGWHDAAGSVADYTVAK